MSLRTAIKQSKIMTVVALGAFIWLLATLLSIMGSIDLTSVLTADFVGQNTVGGVVGVVMMALLLGALVMLYSEISEEDPAPESWPPSE